MRTNAIYVLEQPWWDLNSDPDQATVKPFVDGVGRNNDAEIYYSSFYDLSGFSKALKYLRGAGQIHSDGSSLLYVAAHGSKRRIGGEVGNSVNLASALSEIQEFSKITRLSGVIFGSCNIGKSDIDLAMSLYGTPLRWIMGYRYIIDWTTSMLFDIAVLTHFINAETADLEGWDNLKSTFQSVTSIFAGDYEMAEDAKGNKKTFKDTVLVAAQPSGKGHHPAWLNGEELWPTE